MDSAPVSKLKEQVEHIAFHTDKEIRRLEADLALANNRIHYLEGEVHKLKNMVALIDLQKLIADMEKEDK
jgi:chemotaxis signal transduction protein